MLNNQDLISVRYYMAGIGFIPGYIPRNVVIQLIKSLRRQPEETRDVKHVNDILIDPDMFRSICREIIGTVQVEPCTFDSVHTALNCLRVAAQKEEGLWERRTEIETTGDGKDPSLYRRMWLYMEILEIPPQFVVLACPN